MKTTQLSDEDAQLVLGAAMCFKAMSDAYVGRYNEEKYEEQSRKVAAAWQRVADPIRDAK